MQRYVKSDFDVTLPSDMLYNPDGDEGTLRRFVQRRAEEDREEKEAAAKRAEQQAAIDELKAKYPQEAIEEAGRAAEPIEALFKLAVPPSGQCDSVAGEIIRAMMKILYRDYNDGDVFYEGYGRETCLPAVAYLIEMEPYEGILEDFEHIAEDRLHDDEYTSSLNNIADTICDFITQRNLIEWFWTPNDRDYFDTSTEGYDAWEPHDYMYEGELPESLVEAMFDDKVSRSEVESSIEEALSWEGPIDYDYLSVGEYGWSVEGLNLDDYERLQETGSSIGDYVVDDLEIDRLDDDEDDDVWSATRITSATAFTQHLEVTKEWNDLFWHDTNFKEWALRRDEDYSEGYDFIDDDTKVYCEADVTDIRYNPKYDFLLLDITFTTERFEDGEYIEETAGVESYKFPITRKVEKLLGE